MPAETPVAPTSEFLKLRLNWQTPNSRAVAHWAYERSDARLWVIFRSNLARAYAYEGIADDIVLDMLGAPSIGSYVSRKVRNQYLDTRFDLAARAAS